MLDFKKKEGYVFGYTYIDNIKNHTIPENVLENEILKGNTTLEALKSYLMTFEFEEYENPEITFGLKYKWFFIYESIVVDISARDRISLLFNQNDNLIGIIHSRPLQIDDFKTYKLIRGHSLTIFANIDKAEIQRMIDKLINSYNSMD